VEGSASGGIFVALERRLVKRQGRGREKGWENEDERGSSGSGKVRISSPGGGL